MQEIAESVENIWSGDVLGRKEDARYLQNYLVKRYETKKAEPGFVLAINAEWGFGKSFLLERWKQQVLLENHPVVFFDAWKNDFTEDPLLAFIAELDSGLEDYFKKIAVGNRVSRAVTNNVKKLWKPALKVLAFAAVKQVAGISAGHLHQMFSEGQEVKNVVSSSDADKSHKMDIKNIGDNLKNALDKALKDHKSTKMAIAEFKSKLSLLIEALDKASGVQLPLIIFVDELDRCRPDYAIQLLEGIKHLFGVSGVYFVIATNVSQLSESVKAIYGAGFDGQRYLKRFFDLQYLLREPSNNQFATLLVKGMDQPEIHFLVHGLEQVGFPKSGTSDPFTSESLLIYILEKHIDCFELSLRDQFQVATILEAVFITLKDNKIHIFFLVFLAVIYQIDPIIFRKIVYAANITEATGFSKIHKNNGLGNIDYYVFTNGGRGSASSQSVINIGEMYLRSMRISISEKHTLNAHPYDFPSNLLSNLNGREVGTNFIASFSDYSSLIERAGCFSLEN